VVERMVQYHQHSVAKGRPMFRLNMCTLLIHMIDRFIHSLISSFIH